MKNADEKLTALWKSARSVPSVSASDQENLAPGIAARIASRWATQASVVPPLVLLERTVACCLIPAAISPVIIVWMQPAPAKPDLMSALFNARIEIEDDFSF